MKKAIPYFLFMVFLSLVGTVKAGVLPDGTICVYLKNGHVDVFPGEVIKAHQEKGDSVQITLKTDSVITYLPSEVDSLGQYPTNFPSITSFKFNNKFNDNVYIDVLGTIAGNKITASVGAIGKSLTPSFKVSSDSTQVYANGALQESKVSRLRFDKPVTYTATYPGYRKLHFTKLKDEEWSEGTPSGPILEQIPLKVGQLYTNHPGNSYESLDLMLDGNENTFFHSTYGEQVEAPYVLVRLDEPVSSFVLKYTTRPDRADYCPLEMIIECSNDGTNWKEVKRLTESDGIPVFGYSMKYTSPNLSLGGSYSMLRFTVPAVEHKNRKYFVLAEFSLNKYLGESEGSGPELISPAVYDYTWIPFGRDYEVTVDWLAESPNAQFPRIDINIENGKFVVDKVNYLKAKFIVDGGGIFPDMTDSVLIKGRGNSTWHGPGQKNPYRLKFAMPVKPFGLTKGKNWVLLANSMPGSMLTNAIGMKIARMVGTVGANDIVPVDLYINGRYQGNYNFTQHVGLHNNSVDLFDETNAVMFELDTYGGEPFHFRSQPYGLSVNVKDPDLDEIPRVEANAKLDLMKTDFNAFCNVVSEGRQIEDYADAKMLARYLLVNELIDNEELKHPKSCFLFREDLLAKHSKYVFGPVWDLDWAYGYEGGYQHCVGNANRDYFQRIAYSTGGQFYNDLRFNSDYIKRCYYQEWSDFLKLHLTELQEFIDDYYIFVAKSLERNADCWGGDGYGYRYDADRFKSWLTERAHYIYSTLDVYDLDKPLPIERGDVNKDGAITLADAVCVFNQILGLENETFDRRQADANENGEVSVVDAVWIIGWAMQAENSATRQMMLPKAEARVQTKRFTAALGTVSEFPVMLNILEGKYVAAQFDVVLPEGMQLADVALPEEWKDRQVDFVEMENHEYRVVVYADNASIFPAGEVTLKLSVIADAAIGHADRVVTLKNVTLVNAQGEDERMSGKSAEFDMEVTGIEGTSGSAAVSGGHALTIESLAEGEVKVYTLDGRLVRVCPVTVGVNHIDLPTGIYLVNQQKVVINK